MIANAAFKMISFGGAAGTSIGRFGMTTAKAIFNKTSTTAKKVFTDSKVKNDVLLKTAGKVGQGYDSISSNVGYGISRMSSGLRRSKFMRGAKRATQRWVGEPIGKATKGASKQYHKLPSPVRQYAGRVAGTIGAASKGVVGLGVLGVGATAMMGLGIMNGMNNAAKDILLERYMQDQRYSRNMLLQSRVGLAMGTNSMNRMSSTMGLTNSLSRTRHGASY